MESDNSNNLDALDNTSDNDNGGGGGASAKRRRSKKRKPSRFKMTENLATIRKALRVIYDPTTVVNDKLFIGGRVGDFAIRYLACILHKREDKLILRQLRRTQMREKEVRQVDKV